MTGTLPGGWDGSVLALLADLRGLPDAVAQVVQLRPAHLAPADPLDLGDRGGVQREGALDAHAVADLADLEGLADARAGAADHHALEDLDALLLALDHPHVDLDGVPGAEVGDVGAEVRLIDQGGGVHRVSLRRGLGRAGRRSPAGPCA